MLLADYTPSSNRYVVQRRPIVKRLPKWREASRAGAFIVTIGGRVALSVEGRGKRLVPAEWLERDDVKKAKEVLAAHLRGEKNARYLMLPDI